MSCLWQVAAAVHRYTHTAGECTSDEIASNAALKSVVHLHKLPLRVRCCCGNATALCGQRRARKGAVAVIAAVSSRHSDFGVTLLHEFFL